MPDRARTQREWETWTRPALLPEEDAIGDPGDEDNEQDDSLPADLWY